MQHSAYFLVLLPPVQWRREPAEVRLRCACRPAMSPMSAAGLQQARAACAQVLIDQDNAQMLMTDITGSSSGFDLPSMTGVRGSKLPLPGTLRGLFTLLVSDHHPQYAPADLVCVILQSLCTCTDMGAASLSCLLWCGSHGANRVLDS